VGVLLSGLGHGDGSDVQETVLTTLYLQQAAADATFIAPGGAQLDVIDHHATKKVDERRDILIESSRATRKKILPLDQIDPAQLNALIIPGGLGAVKNLCDFFSAGENCRVHEGVRHLVGILVRRKRAIGVLSHGAVLLARILQNRQGITPTLTVGNDAEMAGHIQAMGGINVPTKADEALIDEQNRLVSAAGLISGGDLAVAARGIENLVRGVLELVHRGDDDGRGEDARSKD
jgi:enhancing lycopene biosynthesis protein 2